MPRYRFTQLDAIKGGKARAALPDFPQLCIMGWEATAHRHGMQASLAIVHKRSGKRKKQPKAGL